MAGLLDLVREYGAGVKERVGLLGRDPMEFTRQALLDVVPNEAEYQAAKGRLLGGPSDEQAYQAYLGKIQDMGSFLGSIKVFHGSPHKFDKFDLSKIGTGEGAQAYGHGLYTAESRGVAEQYKNALSDTLDAPMNTPALEKRAGQMALTFGDNTSDGAVKWLQKHRNGAKHTSPAMTPELVDDVIRRFQSGEFRPGGYLYEANLRWPDAAREAADPMGPQHFLDWDAPLSKQPAAVREIMEPYVAPMRAIEAKTSGAEWGDLAAPRDYDPTGSELLKLFRGGLDRMDADTVLSGGIGPEVSAALRAKGIPGIRYLDAGSRAAGGTSNYVVFDDMLIDILTRNGVPLK